MKILEIKMKKRNKIIFTIFICVLPFLFCQRKLFKKIDIQGRLVNFITNEPISTKIVLKHRDASTAKDVPYLTYDDTNSNSDGTFNFKGRAAKTTSYYLLIGDEPNEYQKYEKYIKVNEGAITNLGDVPYGDFTFSCQITLNPISTSSISIYPGRGKGQTYNFPAGTYTTFTQTSNYTISDYEGSGNRYVILYNTIQSGTTTNSVISLPIMGTNTLSTTINY